ncbi:hypothetical protein ACJZ2D_003084 [Fusarium nematophilum]
MRVGIVNAGNIGLSLAIPWIRSGHDIMLSKETHQERLRERTRAFGLNTTWAMPNWPGSKKLHHGGDSKGVPDAAVFKAFNLVPATLLDAKKWTSGRVPALFFLGGNSSSTDTVQKLIEDAGFRPKFAGHDIRDAGLLEGLDILLHRLVGNEYHGDAGIAFDVIRHQV